MVGIIMGSSSDLPVLQAAADLLAEWGIPYEMTVVSAHRTPERMVEYAREALPGKVATGRFGADMKVALVNDGPVTFWLRFSPQASANESP